MEQTPCEARVLMCRSMVWELLIESIHSIVREGRDPLPIRVRPRRIRRHRVAGAIAAFRGYHSSSPESNHPLSRIAKLQTPKAQLLLLLISLLLHRLLHFPHLLCFQHSQYSLDWSLLLFLLFRRNGWHGRGIPVVGTLWLACCNAGRLSS